MGVEIAITVAREETRVAVLDNGVVTDLFGDRAKHKDFVGNIYKGKVAKVLPGMQAAFVDIGLEKAAFVHVSDLSLDAILMTTIRTRTKCVPDGKAANPSNSCSPKGRN
jgi:ribonuclease G